MADEAKKPHEGVSRRGFVWDCLRAVFGLGVAGSVLPIILRRGRGAAPPAAPSPREGRMVWQVDPAKCIQCGRCATNCVLDTSAVKCVHDFDMCGYCKICLGYFKPQPIAYDSGAENQACPTGAIRRRFVEDPYFEYVIDEKLCIGCGRCVKGCQAFGNGSLYLQVRHDRCLNCNECSIAARCPADAFVRLPAAKPYIIKHLWIERHS